MCEKSLADRMHALHKRQYPNCTFGDEPHFVPPSFGQVGFYLCDPPADLANYSRMTTDEALTAIALVLIDQTVSHGVNIAAIHKELTEDDWLAVINRARELTSQARPTEQYFEKACALLATGYVE